MKKMLIMDLIMRNITRGERKFIEDSVDGGKLVNVDVLYLKSL